LCQLRHGFVETHSTLCIKAYITIAYMTVRDAKYLTGGGVRRSGIVDSGRVGSNFGGCTEITVGISEKAVPRFSVIGGSGAPP
jgi:hypothetical protein